MCFSQMATSRVLCSAIQDEYGACQIELHLTLSFFNYVIAERSLLSQRLDELLSQEETIWCQRSRVLWLRGGDLNTKFFHRRACNRKAKNKIKGLTNTHGKWQDGNHKLKGDCAQLFWWYVLIQNFEKWSRGHCCDWYESYYWYECPPEAKFH